jgi:AcrR family transcriptional regulator
MSEGGILRAAIDVFGEHGYLATRVEDILQAAGVARRTFYKYFSSKDDLLSAIYALATNELLGQIQSAGTIEEKDPLDAIRRGLDAYLDYHVANARLLRVLVQQAIRSDSPLFVHRKKFRDDLVRLIDAAVRLSTKEEHDPLLYAALISAVEGVSLELLESKATEKDVERAKDALHLIFERTLRPAGI